MEPERNIEKLLRTYAKKRREQADASLKMHPATRRLLQDEIARNKPAEDDGEESLSLWELIRQQWAFLLSFAVVMFLLAMMLFPVISASKRKAQTIASLNNLAQLGAAAQTAAEDNNGKLPATLGDLPVNARAWGRNLIDPESGKPFVYVAGGENLYNLPTNAVLAYSAEDREGRAVLFADGSVKYLNSKDFVQATNTLGPETIAMNEHLARREAQQAQPPVPAGGTYGVAPVPEVAATTEVAPQIIPPPPPASAPTVESTFAENSSPSAPVEQPMPASPAEHQQVVTAAPGNSRMGAYTFANDQSHSSSLEPAAAPASLAMNNYYRNSVAPEQKVQVLANFQLQQNGNTIRVVDQDGSVYEGALLALNQNTTKEDNGKSINSASEQDKVTAQGGGGGGFGGVGGAANSPASDAFQAAQSYFFRVNGTNRTLNQNVEFTGNLLANIVATKMVQQKLGVDTGLAYGAGLAASQLAGALTNQLPQLPWSNLRITGTCLVNSTNRVEVNAAPVIPAKN
jgi:type II secretory pathway pseudopilin PulG